ncbi:MAG TPA: 23S rRNA (uracil(1939)-C(5))-methyltransferase RlmD [Candidatus Limnocylindrales bacterium]|nr:23S rRNA (uracil(1939)-C(5))-methyltransferase RlmD [Candidatus Limnocylindrales bacterium]
MTAPFDARIEKLVYGGDGLSHHKSHTVFVPYTMPGELVRVVPLEERKKFIRGRIDQILEPSPDRVAAPCPEFGICGGCHYQHIPYDQQLKFKTEILRETLARIGKIEWPGEIKAIASPPFGYRNRAQWAIRLIGDPPRSAIGYFKPASSILAPTKACPILMPQLESVLAALGAACEQGRIPGGIGAIESFSNASGDKMLLNVSVAKSGMKSLAISERLREIVPGIESILIQDETAEHFELFGPGYLEYHTEGVSFRVGHLSFFQVNRFLVEELVRSVVTEKNDYVSGGGLALDLFAGVGLFSIPLAKRFERVIAVEGDIATSRDLEVNVKTQPSIRGRHADTESFLARQKESPDFVVLDPPRAGVTAAAIQRLRELAPPHITYLSCDPATLARDLAALTAGGGGTGSRYRIGDITVYDIFPETYHIEALVRLQRLG